jgi:phosphatidylglycerophosphate synthase
VLSRDVLLLVVATVILIIQGYRPFPPSLLGKATTLFEIALVFFVIFTAAFPNQRAASVIHYLVLLVAALVIVSGFHYAFVTARRLHVT